MDKIEYRELIKSIKNRYLKKDYEGVIDLSDQIELERIRENSILEIVAKSYEALGRCDLAREALLIAYKRTPSGKRIAYNLAMLCIKLDDLDSAVMFYEDFCKMAPRDNQRLILKYEIGRAGDVPIKDLVRVLEVYNSREMDDKWEYELARLYHEMGDGEKCAATCDQVILWYANGEYEKKALELKNMHKALTPEQQSRYEEIMAGILNDGATIVPVASRKATEIPEPVNASEQEQASEQTADIEQAAESDETFADEESVSAEEQTKAVAEEPKEAVEEQFAEANAPTLDIPSAQNWNRKSEPSATASSAEPPVVHEIEYDTKHLGSEGEASDGVDNENIEGQMSVLSMLEAYKQKTAEDVDNKVGKDRAAQIMAEVASTHDSSALEEFEGDEEEFMQEESVEVIEPEVPLFNREDVIEPEDDGGEDIGERAAEFDFEKKSKDKKSAAEVIEEEQITLEHDHEESEEELEDEADDIEDSESDEDEYSDDEIEDEEYEDSDDEYDEEYEDEYDETEYDDEEYYEEDDEEYRPAKSKSYKKKEKRRSMADDILDDMVVDGGFTIEEDPEDEYDESDEDEYDDIDETDSEDEYDEVIEDSEDECNESEDDSEDECDEISEETEAEYDAEDVEAAGDFVEEKTEESEGSADENDEVKSEEIGSDEETKKTVAEPDREDLAESETEKLEPDTETEYEEAETEEAEDEYDENEIEESEEEYDEDYDSESDDEYEETDTESDIADQVAAAFEEFDDGKTAKKAKAEKVVEGSCVQEVAAGIGDVFGSLFKKNKKANVVEDIGSPEGVFEIEEAPEEIVVQKRGNKGQAKGKYAPERTLNDKEQIRAEKARIKAEKDKAKAEKAREKAEKIRQKAERLLTEKAKKEELAAEQETVKPAAQPAEKKRKEKKVSADQELFQTVEPKGKTAQNVQKAEEVKIIPEVQATEEVKAEPKAQKAVVKEAPIIPEAAEAKADTTVQTSSEEFNLEEFINEEIGRETVQTEKTETVAEPKKEQTVKSGEETELAASIEEIVAKSAESLLRDQKRTAKPLSKTMREKMEFSSAVVTPAQGVARNAATVAAAQSIANPAAARLFAENPEPDVPANDITSKLPKLVVPAFIKNKTNQKKPASLDPESLDEILNSAIKDSEEEKKFTVDVDELLDETIKDESCKKGSEADMDGFNLEDFIDPNGGENNKSAAKKQAAFDEIFGKSDKDAKTNKEESKPKKTFAAATQPLPKIQIQSPARKFGVGEYKLSREQKKELAEFLLIDGMEEEICSTIAKLVTKKKSGDETGGHLIVTGDAKTGKTFLTVEILKAVNQEVGHGNTRVAKVQAQAINGKNIMDVLSKVTDSDLIIENIGRLEDDTVLELIQAVRASNAPTMIILEGNELAADTMIQNFPDIGKIFKTRINIGELTLTQWADLAQKYAASQGYSIDGMAQLALHAKIDQINTPDMRLGFKQVRQIIDDAIDKAEKRSSAKLFSAFGKKNDEELIPLMEDNFM